MSRAHPVRRARGFTLLEVMAAVLVLGMLYTVLATAAMRGLRSEGDTKRRIQASLLADSRLSDLELELALGQVPKSGQTQESIENFVVDVIAKPMDGTVLTAAGEEWTKQHPKHKVGQRQKPMGSTTGGAAGSGTGAFPGTGASAQGGAAASSTAAKTKKGFGSLGGGQQGSGLGGTPGAQVDPAAAAIGESLLVPQGPGQEGRLREIDVVVRWQEGDAVKEVTRTTFAFDSSGLEQVFPPKGEGPGEEANTDDAKANEIEQMLKQLSGAPRPQGGGGDSGAGQ